MYDENKTSTKVKVHFNFSQIFQEITNKWQGSMESYLHPLPCDEPPLPLTLCLCDVAAELPCVFVPGLFAWRSARVVYKTLTLGIGL